MKRIPETAGEMLDRLMPEIGRWRVEVAPSEPTDPSPHRVMFSIAGSQPGRAYVAWEHGRLVVSIHRGAYWFDLPRLHESERWDWIRQVEEKGWRDEDDMALLRALYEVLP